MYRKYKVYKVVYNEQNVKLFDTLQIMQCL